MDDVTGTLGHLLAPWAQTQGGAVIGNPPMRRSLSRLENLAAVADIERQLTPQEMQIVNYHRNSVAKGNIGRDPSGYPVTVYSNTIQIPSGPQRGKFVTVPGWFDGRMNDDEAILYRKWAAEINAGKWPVYDSPDVADSRAKFLHGIMDRQPD